MTSPGTTRIVAEVEQRPYDAHVPKQLHEELKLRVRRGVHSLVVAVEVPQIPVALRRVRKQLRLLEGLHGLHGRLDVEAQFVIIHRLEVEEAVDEARHEVGDVERQGSSTKVLVTK